MWSLILVNKTFSQALFILIKFIFIYLFINIFSTIFTLLLSVYGSLFKIENNPDGVNFTHFREKTHLLALELFFVQLKLTSLHVYKNWCLKWKVRMAHKERSVFAKWAHTKQFGCISSNTHSVKKLTWQYNRTVMPTWK